MREYGFSLTHIIPDKDRNVDSVLIWENIFFAVPLKPLGSSLKLSRANKPTQ